MDWHVPLVVAALAFLALMVFRLAPMGHGEDAANARAALKAARKRLEAATTDEERVSALVEAGNASARLVSGGGRAVQYYLRAMKVAPGSADLVERVVKGMAKRPRGLENILWRRLGSEPWSSGDAAVLAAILTHLGALYAGPLKSSVRARAFANMLNMIAARSKPTAHDQSAG